MFTQSSPTWHMTGLRMVDVTVQSELRNLAAPLPMVDSHARGLVLILILTCSPPCGLAGAGWLQGYAPQFFLRASAQQRVAGQAGSIRQCDFGSKTAQKQTANAAAAALQTGDHQ